MKAELVPLIDRQDLNKECIRLLNEEWPRSDGSREHSQAKSCRSSPPMSLLLLVDGQLVGHSRVCLLPNRRDACWVESVVIAKVERTRGLGRRLMNMTEEFVRQLGFSQVYLCTEDQEVFYRRCGYEKCDPILHSTTATSVFPMNLFSPVPALNSHPEEQKVVNESSLRTGVPPPPPPPSLPRPSSAQNISFEHHIYMKKSIAFK